MFLTQLFVRLKRENNDAIGKIIPIKGDVSQINLGLSEEDQKMLKKEISIVFHSAASVRYNFNP